MSFPPGTEMFQFPGFASLSLCIQQKDNLISKLQPMIFDHSLTIGSNLVMKLGFPIRKSLGQRLLTPHQRLSQRATSFIACACQGIHQMPLPHA
jgi:hypothetical protein